MSERYQTGSKAPDFNFINPWGGGSEGEKKNFYSDSKGQKKVLFFLRYYGCRVTQLEFRDIVAESGKISSLGARLYVLLQSAPETMRDALKQEDIAFELICDPGGELYRLFDVGYAPLGYFIKSLPGNWTRSELFEKRIAEASALGITHGLYEGNEQQLPAVFVLDENQNMLLAHYSKDIVDVPSVEDILKYL
ncbi:hypothetical protein FACS1894187_19660 [Synergistales bacterium]|nr:hypothetical protein FACS1894187_19660 [Synergistales bacterium]